MIGTGVNSRFNAAYIQEIPGPNLTLLVSADHSRFSVTEGRAATIGIVGVGRKVVKHFAVREVHEADVGVQRRGEDRLRILGRHKGGNGIFEETLFLIFRRYFKMRTYDLDNLREALLFASRMCGRGRPLIRS